MYKIQLTFNETHKQNNTKQSVVTIGNYDGCHLGHMQLISQVNDTANKKNLKRILVTFEPLPQEFFIEKKQGIRRSRLGLIRDKCNLLYNNGNPLVDEIIILRFTENLAIYTPELFIKDILINKLNMTDVIIGHDFKFGINGSGNYLDFIQYGIEVKIIEPYYIDTHRVSSSLIRTYANENNLPMVYRYLGRNLCYTSRVVHGNHLGRKYGVPTINLCLGRNRPALCGIYAAYVYINNVRYNAVASIGRNPTIDDSNIYKLEAHLLDIDLDLYGFVATVEILSFLRPEMKFDNLELLFKQIYADLDNTRLFFTKREKILL